MQENYSDLGAVAVDDYSDLGAVPVELKNPKKEFSLSSLLKSFGTGFSTGFEGLAHGLIQPVLESGALGKNASEVSKMMAQERQRKYQEAQIENPISAGIGNLAGSVVGSIPAMAIPGVGQGNLIRGIIQGALQSAAVGGSEYVNEDESRLKNALIASPFGAVGGAVAGGIEALRPSNLMRGTLRPEQLSRNLEVTKGTQTPIGDVIQSPTAKQWFENILAKLPFSGGHQTMLENAQNIEQKGISILGNLLGGNSAENVPQQIAEDLKVNFAKATKNKNEIYEEANNIADTSGLKLHTKNFEDKLNNFQDAIENTQILKYEPDLTKILSKFEKWKGAPVKQQEGIVDTKGKPISEVFPTLKEASLLKGRLGQLGREFSQSSKAEDRYQGKIFTDLSKSLKEDISNSIEKHGSEELKNTYNKAEKNYRKEFSPFLEKEVYKYANQYGKSDTDLITQAFAKSSRTSDRSNLLKKLVDRLSSEKRHLVAYDYLSKALDQNGTLNPQKLSTLINKLGKRQFEALIPDTEIRKSISNYRDLSKLNNESLNIMFNPKTGQRNSNLLAQLLTHAGGAALGAFGGEQAQGAPGALAGALAGAVLPGVAARPLVKAMTSEKSREKLVQAMLKNKKLPIHGVGAIAGAASTRLPLILYLNKYAGVENGS